MTHHPETDGLTPERLETLKRLASVKLGYNDLLDSGYYVLAKVPCGPWDPLTEGEIDALLHAPKIIDSLSAQLDAARANALGVDRPFRSRSPTG